MKKINVIFKFLIIIILVSFVYVLYLFSLNGRYVSKNDGSLVLDTKTGIVYRSIPQLIKKR